MTKYNKRMLGIKSNITRAFMKFAWRQVHINKFGFFGSVTGLPGHGKSETSLLMAWLQDETFDEDSLNETYIRNAKDFIKRVDGADKHEWIVWGETALTLSSRKWYDLSNILVSEVIQTMRTKELGILFDTPNIGHIDKRARELFQWFTEVKRWEDSPVYWKIHNVEIHQRYNKVHFPHPIFNVNGSMEKLKGIVIKSRLPDGILERFDKLHKKFKDEKIKKDSERISLITKKEEGIDIWDVINIVQKKQKDYLNVQGKLDKDLIMLKQNVSRDRASQIAKFIEKQK